MSAYLKETLASMPQHLQSLRSIQVGPYLRNMQLPQLPQNIQSSTTDLSGKASKLHSKNPKAFIALLVLVFLLFWKNIIYDVCTHFTGQYKPAEVVDKNPIRNGTLGVGLLSALLASLWLIRSASSKIYLSSRCLNEVTGESLCWLPPMPRISQ